MTWFLALFPTVFKFQIRSSLFYNSVLTLLIPIAIHLAGSNKKASLQENFPEGCPPLFVMVLIINSFRDSPYISCHFRMDKDHFDQSSDPLLLECGVPGLAADLLLDAEHQLRDKPPYSQYIAESGDAVHSSSPVFEAAEQEQPACRRLTQTAVEPTVAAESVGQG